jgi:UDP-glucose:(heptosyl)LPS alpha-1,3-glucosyltransferase
MGVSNRVRFLGPQTDVRPYLAAADAFLQPAWYDPFPNACLEALACGLPVIASSSTGTAELIRSGENGSICQAGDPDDLLQQMKSLQPGLGDKALHAAAAATVYELRVERMLGQFATLYGGLMNDR